MVSPHPNATGSGTGSRQPHLSNLRQKESLGIMMLVSHINVDYRGRENRALWHSTKEGNPPPDQLKLFLEKRGEPQ